MKRIPWFVWATGLFWILLFALARFTPSESELLLRFGAWSKFSGADIPLNFARELAFPLPITFLSLITPTIPLSLFLFRGINLVLTIIWLILAYKLFEKLKPTAGKWFLVLASTTLWIVWTLMTSVPTAIVLTLIFAILNLQFSDYEHKETITAFLAFWLVLTSISGWLFVIVFWIWRLAQKFDLKVLIIGILILTCGFLMSGKTYYETNFKNTAAAINDNTGNQVDIRVRYETKLNNYREPVPLLVKRMVYNKIYFGYREIARKIGSLFSLEKIAFPGQGDATVTRNLWGSKDLGWMAWWLIPVGIIGLTGLSKYSKNTASEIKLLGVWGISGLIFGGGNYLEDGIGLCLALLVSGAFLIAGLKYKWKVLCLLLVIAVSVPTFHHFFTHELIWRDNRPDTELKMAQMANANNATQVTTILGRSFLYYGWINQIKPEEFWDGIRVGMKIRGVKFDHFEKPGLAGVYTGLPGEFLGSRGQDNKNDFSDAKLPDNWKLLDRQKTVDTLSFGNGDYIWTVEIK